ncbi:MAG TPA: NAD(P)-dependent oxidoreductase, partial [Flavisolibacter sp.]|nr:NAD(P)-dependent oxidoreductase [Flavisolibacter sp.]
MKDTMVLSKKVLLPLKINTHEVKWLVVGGGTKAFDSITQLLGYSHKFSITVVAEDVDASIKRVAERHHSVNLIEKGYEPGDLSKFNMIIVATDNKILDEKIQAEAKQQNVLVFLPANSQISDFAIAGKEEVEHTLNNQWFQRNTDKPWKNLATKLIWGFVLMVVGYIIISYLPLPPWSETWRDVKPFFDYKFLFFVVAGFLAQMVDGMLSMGYGVTSATCLMSFG